MNLEFDKENYGVKNNNQVILGIDELLTGLDVKLNHPSIQGIFTNFEKYLRQCN